MPAFTSLRVSILEFLLSILPSSFNVTINLFLFRTILTSFPSIHPSFALNLMGIKILPLESILEIALIKFDLRFVNQTALHPSPCFNIKQKA
jgi:hypothetical protein